MKGLRFLKISSYYRGFLTDYYHRYPQLQALSFGEQYEHLMGQYFAWSDNYGRLLSQKGLETMEVVANATPLQRAWLRENSLSGNLSLNEIVTEQIRIFKPDVVYFQDSITYNGAYVNYLRTKFPFIRLCIGNICAPFSSSQIESFQAFDYFTVCSPFFKYQLDRYRIPSVVIPHAFDGRILQEIDLNNPYGPAPFLFSGSIFAGEGFHTVRRQILERLIGQQVPFVFYGNLPDRSMVGLLKRQASFFASRFFDGVGMKSVTDSIEVIRKGRNHQTMPRGLHLSKELYRIARPPLFGIEMFKALSRAEIGFNVHIDCAGDYVANMRLFETTGVGTCLVTDRKGNMNDFFEEDREVVVYDSASDCVEKIKWLIDHPQECKSIAQRGQQRTLKEHNFESRIELFYSQMKSWIK